MGAGAWQQQGRSRSTHAGRAPALCAPRVFGLCCSECPEKEQSGGVWCMILYVITSQKSLPPSGEITLKEEKDRGGKVISLL